MDRRQVKTRAAIFDAFAYLLTRESFSKITVQEIIDRAEVGRTTFYAHFETKDDLLREMCAEIFDHVFSEHRHAENNHDFSEDGGLKASVTHILYHLRDSRFNIPGILNSESGDLLRGIFKQYLNKSLAARILKDLRPKDAPLNYLENHISGSFVSTVQWWNAQGLKDSPETVASYYLSVIEPVISGLEHYK